MDDEKRRFEDDGVNRAESGADTDRPALAPRRSDEVGGCETYERLIQELETRRPEAADFDHLSAHEAACPTGRHSEAGVEKALGLPPGALRHGAPELGLPSPIQLIGNLIDKHLRLTSHSQGRCPGAAPRQKTVNEDES